jgi:hypothetical protein
VTVLFADVMHAMDIASASTGMLRLLVQGNHQAVIVELADAVCTGIGYSVSEVSRRGSHSTAEVCSQPWPVRSQPGPVEDVVAQHECYGILDDVVSAEDQRPSEPGWNRLHCVADGGTELGTIAQ